MAFQIKKLIPLVRIATTADGNNGWVVPKEEDAKAWANFLGLLPWPIQKSLCNFV